MIHNICNIKPTLNIRGEGSRRKNENEENLFLKAHYYFYADSNHYIVRDLQNLWCFFEIGKNPTS